jgi:hypothetical protein
MQESRWKIAPRVALLACTVGAEMVSVSQLLSSSEAGPSQATVALSAILVIGILLLVVLLPVAFFRVKLQDARERVHFRKVFTLLALSMCDRTSSAPTQVEIAIAKNLALQQEMSEIRPRVLPDEDSHTPNRIRAGTAAPDGDESGAAQQASTRSRAKVDAAMFASVLHTHRHSCDVRLDAKCAQHKPPWSIQMAQSVPLTVRKLFGLDKRLAQAEIRWLTREHRASRASRANADMARVVQVAPFACYGPCAAIERIYAACWRAAALVDQREDAACTLRVGVLVQAGSSSLLGVC